MKFYEYSGHKHVETEPSYSNELATLLKYHMLLKIWVNRTT